MEQILVQQFKAIQNRAGIAIPVQPLTIFMGEQATGKSTLAKLIYFFKTVPHELITEVLAQPVDGLDDPLKVINLRLRRYFVYLFGATRHLENFSISYTYPSGYRLELSKDPRSGNLFIGLGYGREELIKWINLYQQRMREVPPDLFDASSRRERGLIEQALGRDIMGLFGVDGEARYIPASRNMTVVLENSLEEVFGLVAKGIESLSLRGDDRPDSQNELLIYHFLQHAKELKQLFSRGGGFAGVMRDRADLLGEEFSEDMQRRLQLVIDRTQQVLKGQYRTDTYGEKIYLDQDRYVFLANASSGQQETIRLFQDLFVEILREKPSCRIYEEPESHLFPLSQKLLMEAVACYASADAGNQMIIPTHSPYTLLAIDNLIKAGEMAHAQPQLDALITEQTHIPPQMRLRFDQVSAWWLQDGEFTNALSEERQGINPDYVDQVATEMEQTYDDLLSLRYDHADL
jgi:hypothetical protein